MTKLLLCDIDKTLTTTISGQTFKQHPRDVTVLPGVEAALKHACARGWKVTGVSNQAGIEAGYKTLEDCIEEMHYTIELLPHLDGIFFCPDRAGRRCWYVTAKEHWSVAEYNPYQGLFRKPQPGMLLYAIKFFKADKMEETIAWMVGDRSEDEEAATNAGINFIHADVWRTRFIPGQIYDKLENSQIELLEGINLDV